MFTAKSKTELPAWKFLANQNSHCQTTFKYQDIIFHFFWYLEMPVDNHGCDYETKNM